MRVAAIAGVVLAVTLTAGFALQAAGLPPAARADVVAAKAAEWLRGYRYATSTLLVAGRTLHGRCFHGWFGGRLLRTERGTILELPGASVRTLPHRLVADGLPPWLRPEDALVLAGCPQVLSARLDTLALGAATPVERATAWGRPVLAVRFRRLTLLVDPATDRPLGVELPGARSRFRLVRLTAKLERRLEALR
ncbi:MAG: hypothetical protein V7644_1926 [Actinomycetota bacterium]|jgi:hypothetical protein